MTKTRTLAVAGLAACALAGLTPGALAETRVTLKSAKSSASYYLMTVQLGEALKAADPSCVATVEECQGSVQNVKETKTRGGNFIFTTPPSLLASAREGRKPFEDGAFDNARTLFVMPFVTVHLVARSDAGIGSIADLAGKTMIPGGKGNDAARTAWFRL